VNAERDEKRGGCADRSTLRGVLAHERAVRVSAADGRRALIRLAALFVVARDRAVGVRPHRRGGAEIGRKARVDDGLFEQEKERKRAAAHKVRPREAAVRSAQLRERLLRGVELVAERRSEEDARCDHRAQTRGEGVQRHSAPRRQRRRETHREDEQCDFDLEAKEAHVEAGCHFQFFICINKKNQNGVFFRICSCNVRRRCRRVTRRHSTSPTDHQRLEAARSKRRINSSPRLQLADWSHSAERWRFDEVAHSGSQRCEVSWGALGQLRPDAHTVDG